MVHMKTSLAYRKKAKQNLGISMFQDDKSHGRFFIFYFYFYFYLLIVQGILSWTLKFVGARRFLNHYIAQWV